MLANNFGTSHYSNRRIIAGLCQTNDSLNYATVAIAALDASRRSQTMTSRNRGLMCISALKVYHMSLRALRRGLNQKELLDNDNDSDAYLWAAFFLGIFEVVTLSAFTIFTFDEVAHISSELKFAQMMNDVSSPDITAAKWQQHFKYGSSELLRLRGPTRPLSNSFRECFLSIRVSELYRALIFNDNTFLSEPEWKELSHQIWKENSSEWHPKEALVDSMTSCASLNIRSASILSLANYMEFTNSLIVHTLSIIKMYSRQPRSSVVQQTMVSKSKGHYMNGQRCVSRGDPPSVKSTKNHLMP